MSYEEIAEQLRSSAMWEAAVTVGDDQLRQGDLLTNVVVPAISTPLRLFGNPYGQGAIAALAAPEFSAIVVSQCCEVEKGRFISLAPIKSSRPVAESELSAWLRPDPVSDDAPDYVYDCFCLEERDDVRHERLKWKGEEGIKLRIADLALSTPFSGDLTSLRSQRVARMTPYGRMLLRTKLAYFWGRAEAEDAKLLDV